MQTSIPKENIFQVSGVIMKKWVDEIVLILIDIMQEKLQTSKQEVVAFQTFSLSTCFVYLRICDVRYR